jgi:deoxyribose-phosphate aldolase
MKITKRQLRRIIREEKRRMRECGEDMEGASVLDMAVEPVEVVQTEPSMVVESGAAETDMLIEMELASRTLQQVVESVQNAAQLCSNCGPAVAENAPIVAAMATQAEALQEMLEAQVEVIQENVEVAAVAETPVLDLIGDLVQ